jgi:hypothetical protein
MGVVVSVLTLAVALAKDGLVAKFRSLLPKMNRIAGALMVVAGAYVAYYGYYEVRLLIWGQNVDDPIVDGAIRVQEWLQGFVPSPDNAPWYALGAGLIVAGVAAWSHRRRSTSHDVAS